jgi:hypothetical protein
MVALLHRGSAATVEGKDRLCVDFVFLDPSSPSQLLSLLPSLQTQHLLNTAVTVVVAEEEASMAEVVAAALTVVAVAGAITAVAEAITVVEAGAGLATAAAEAIAEGAPTEVRDLSAEEVLIEAEAFAADHRRTTTERAAGPAEVPMADSADRAA